MLIETLDLNVRSSIFFLMSLKSKKKLYCHKVFHYERNLEIVWAG
jgi:hypothetical protein